LSMLLSTARAAFSAIQADEQFHQLVGTASGLGTAVEVYHETLAELYAYFIPYPIELLHKSNCNHVALVAALRAGHGDEAVEVSRKHVDILHRTMFMGLAEGGSASFPCLEHGGPECSGKPHFCLHRRGFQE
jgi:DNA-binding GntR family transcriptional regulator